MKDEWGKEWFSGEIDPLNDYIKNNKLTLTIEYITDRKDNLTYFVCQVKDKEYNLILDIKQRYPNSDEEILGMIKSILRTKKIDKLLI